MNLNAVTFYSPHPPYTHAPTKEVLAELQCIESRRRKEQSVYLGRN
jgi:hypothetical protein